MMSASDGLALGRTMLRTRAAAEVGLRLGAATGRALSRSFPAARRGADVQRPEMPGDGRILAAGLYAFRQRRLRPAPLAFARAIEQRYLALGGRITYKAQVERILTENDRAVGVRLYDNSEHRADVVISCRSYAHDLRHAGRALRQPRHPRAMPAACPCTRRCRSPWAWIAICPPHWATYLLDEPLLIAGEERCEIAIKQYGYDPTLAQPPGKSVVEVMLRSEYTTGSASTVASSTTSSNSTKPRWCLPFWKSSIRGFWNRSRRPTWQRR